MTDPFRYAAFISYSSKDAAFAKRLHAALEHFRIPATLGRFNLAGKANRVYPVFRDREELPAGILDEEIKTALRTSSALIVVCSRNAVESRWVDTEVRYFSSLGRPNRVFAFIPDTQSEASTVDIASNLFPFALREAVDDVLAADARKSRDGFRNAVLKIVAGLISVNAGALRDRNRQRTRRLAALATAGSVSLLAIVLAWIVLSERINAHDALTARAMLLAERGETAAALPYALAGLGAAGSTAEQVIDSLGARFPPIAFVAVSPDTHYAELAPDGSVVVDRTGNYELSIWDANTGARRGAPRRGSDFWFVDDSKRVVSLNDDYQIEFIDSATGQSLAPAEAILPARSGDSVFVGGSAVAAQTGGDTVTVWDARSGQRLAQLYSPNVTLPLHLSASGQRLLTCDEDARCIVWDLSKQVAIAHIDAVASSFAFSPNDDRFASGSGKGMATLWDGSSGAVIQQIRLGSLGAEVFMPLFAADGMRLAIHSGGYSEGRGQLLDARTGALVLDLGTIDSGSDAIRVSADGKRVSVARPNLTGAILDPESGRAVVSFDAPDSFAEVGLAPDASRVVIQSFDHKTSLWNGLTGQKICDLAVEDKISSVQFSFPGGPFLIVPLVTPTTLWSNDGVQLATLGPAAGYAMQISRDGKRLVGLAGEELIGIWDSSQPPIAGSGEELRRQICTATRGRSIPRFTKQDRGARDAVAGYLKGRPWAVCDWHPMSDGTGWSQTTRYWGVKIGLVRDYSERE